MPRKPLDYSNTIIYKIVCNDLNVKYCYVGHTTNFTNRKYEHKRNATELNRKASNYKLYQTIRANNGWANWTMVEIEKYPCNDINEATARERYYYEILNADLNDKNPHRNKTEYYQENKDKILFKNKLYYENHKEEISEQGKEYRSRNKAKIAQDRKTYYQNNLDALKEYRYEKFNCECGGKYTRCSISTHFKTQKHQDFVNKNIDII